MQVVAVPVLREKRKKDKKATEKSPFVQARKKHFLPLDSQLPQENQTPAQRHLSWMPWGRAGSGGVARRCFVPQYDNAVC